MQIDSTTKIVSLISGIVTVVIGVAGFIIDSQLKANDIAIRKAASESEESFRKLKATSEATLEATKAAKQLAEAASIEASTKAKDMDNRARMVELEARLIMQLDAVLAGTSIRPRRRAVLTSSFFRHMTSSKKSNVMSGSGPQAII